MSENTCTKRIILHPGVNTQVGSASALAYFNDYVETGMGQKGLYHYKTYTAEVTKHLPGGGQTIESISVDVYHTESSIIVRPSAPAKEPQVEKLRVPAKAGLSQ
jgi:hypothetical protein